jgi:hypothetical protein
MSPISIDMEQAVNPIGQRFKTQESLSLKLHTGPRAKESTSEGRVHSGRAVLRRLQAINASLSETATKVRAADQVMDTIGRYIEQMKAQLERIIKNYPPFPPGSEERVKVLRSYNAIRKQMDQMTFPSRDRTATTDPMPATTTRDQKAGAENHRTLSLKDLNLPEVSDMANDQEIAAAVRSLTGVDEILQENRAKLATETLGITFPEIANQKWMALQTDEKEIESDLSEDAAALKSRELLHILRTETTKNVIETPLSFVNLSSERE